MTTRPTEEVLLDNATDKVVVVSQGGTFQYANAAAERILGFDADELVGRSVFEFIHPSDRDRVRSTFLEVVGTDRSEPATETYRHRTTADGWVWLESRISPVRSERLDGYVVSSREVSDRIAAEQRADRLRALASVSDDVLWLFAGDWSELYYVNDAVEPVYGLAPETLFDDSTAFLDTVHGDHVEQVLEAMEAASAGASIDIEYRVTHDGASDRRVWVKAVPVTEDGEVTAIAGFSRDVTDRHRRERHLVVVDNLLRHNLRNSLNVVLGATERIERGDDTADATARIRSAVADLLDSAAKQRRIVEALTSGQRQGSGSLRTQLAHAVTDVEDDHPGVTVDSDLRLAEADAEVPTLVGTAVGELLDNAVAHAPGDDPTVGLEARVVDGVVHVDVVDTCPPLPPVEADVLRGEFHAHDSVYHSGGLGLWLVYWCVELSGGDIVVDRPEDGGNRVGIRVPADTGEAAGTDAPARTYGRRRTS